MAGVMSLVYLLPNALIGWGVGSAPTTRTVCFFMIFLVEGFVVQIFSQVFEKQRPGFLTSRVSLLIGPVFVVREVVKRFGVVLFFCDDKESFIHLDRK